MSTVTSTVKNDRASSFHHRYQSFIFFIGCIATILILWSIASVGHVANFHLVIQLLILNTVSQLVIIAIRKSGIAFMIGQAINLAVIAIFGLQTGLIIAFLSHLLVWAVQTVRNKRPFDKAVESLGFNVGAEIIALFFAGLTFIGTSYLIQDSGSLLRAIPWLLAAIVNDQLYFAQLAILKFLKSGDSPLSFWKRSVWAMPINIAIGALGGTLLANATNVLGLSGILLFMLPLILTAYAFNIYMEVNRAQLKTVKNRINELESANQALTLLSQRKESELEQLTKEIETTLIDMQEATKTLVEQKDAVPEEKQAVLLETISQGEEEIGRIIALNEDQDAADESNPNLFNLSALVDSVTNRLAVSAETQQLRLRCVSGDVPTFIEADESMIEQVVHQLITNAIQFTKAGGSIFVTLTTKNGEAHINVEDTGVGIAKSEIANIFDANYQVDKHTTMTNGTGMGLAVVSQNVKALNGSISIESNVDLGTRFSVVLPIGDEQPASEDDATYPDSNSIYATNDYFVQTEEAPILT